MRFSKESQTVKNFVFLIKEGQRDFKDVPDLFNLREVVFQVMEETNENAI